MSEKEPVPLMKIGEIVRRSGLSERMLRHYEELGILHPLRSPRGTRRYTEQDLLTARLAKQLRELDLPLEIATELAEERKSHATGDAASMSVAALLDDLSKRLSERASRALELQTVTLQAAEAVRQCSGCTNKPDPNGCPDCPLGDYVDDNALAALIWRNDDP